VTTITEAARRTASVIDRAPDDAGDQVV